jgi:hypothetical protein
MTTTPVLRGTDVTTPGRTHPGISATRPTSTTASPHSPTGSSSSARTGHACADARSERDNRQTCHPAAAPGVAVLSFVLLYTQVPFPGSGCGQTMQRLGFRSTAVPTVGTELGADSPLAPLSGPVHDGRLPHPSRGSPIPGQVVPSAGDLPAASLLRSREYALTVRQAAHKH